MNIGIVGLGLMGASLAKALKARTNHHVLGMDKNPAVRDAALHDGAVDEVFDDASFLSRCDITFLCLFPVQTVEFVRNNQASFLKGSIVCDICGVKGYVTKHIDALSPSFYYLPSHPMAGREICGYHGAQANLFEGASFIVTPGDAFPSDLLLTMEALVKSIGFSKVVVTTPEIHDRVIAFTSQLPHIISNAYVKSPSCSRHNGFSAGSFKDLSRVAKLNETMWADLFTLNRDSLLFELDTLLVSLTAYRDALKSGDKAALTGLLRDGRVRKEECDDENN